MSLDRWLLAQARCVRMHLALTVGAGVASAVVVVLQALFLSRTVTAVFLEGVGMDVVRTPLAMLLGMIVVRAVLTWVRESLSSEAASRIKTRLRDRLFKRLTELGPLYASGERTGELANTLVEGVESLDAYYSQYLPSLALAVFVPVTVLLFVFPIDLLSGFVFLITAPLIPIFMILIGKVAEILTRRQWQTLGWMSAHFLDVLQGLATLRLFNRSGAQVQTIAWITDRFRVTTLGVLRVAFLSALVLEITGSISTAIVAVEVGLRLLYSNIGFEQAFFVLVLAPEFYLPLRTLGASFHAGMSGVAAGRRMREILDGNEWGSRGVQGRGMGTPLIPTLSQGKSGSAWHSRTSAPPQSLIEFRGVSLSYGERSALRDVSFEIRAGEKVALVGPSGAGKTSIASLLLRFVEPDSGEITMDGAPLHGQTMEQWRDQFAWVPQNPYLFAGTVMENIRLGCPGAGMEKVEHAARLARADEFIIDLPHGYETEMGERGTRLSGGQAQRIALARAILKDSPVLILDEPTSNLDPETEAAVQEAMDRLMENRTALVIAHRLSTTRRADRIVVLDDGAVAEMGTHEELLAAGGLYSRLVEAHTSDVETERREDTTSYWPASLPATPSPAQTFVAGKPDFQPTLASRTTGGSSNWVAGRDAGQYRDAEAVSYWPSHSPAPPLPHSDWEVALRLLRLVAPFGWWIGLAGLLGVATVGAGIGLISTASFLIASAALHPSVADLAVPIVGVRFFGISRGVFRYLERYVSHNVTFRLLGRIRVWFYESVERLPAGELVHERSGDLLNRVVADVETLQHFYVRVLAPPLVALIVGIAMWLFMFQFDSGLALILAAFLLAGGIVVPLAVQKLSEAANSALAGTRSEVTVALVDGIQGMPDLLAFGQAGPWRQKVDQLGRRWTSLQRQIARISAFHGAGAVLLAGAASWTVLLWAVPLVRDGRLDGVLLPVLVLAALASFEAVAPLPLAFQQLGSSIDAGRRLLEVIDRTAESSLARSPSAGKVAVSPASRAPTAALLSVCDLRFRYSSGEPWVLDGVSFDLDEGKRIAIVGASGAGKSTIANLLLRFWDYESGSVALEERDLSEWSPTEVRERVTMVPQRTHLFNATIRDNLLLAKPDATDEEIAQVAQRAGLHNFVQKLPEGYETRVGEQGLQLSGGERQRIAIARALLRKPRLLVLDEPASNLDSLTEREIMGSILDGTRGPAILLITHRLAGLEEMDEILVLHRGRIVERGSHSDLLSSSSHYHRMWDLQQLLLPA